MCTFLGYYLDTLFQEDEKEDIFKAHLKFVIDCVGAQGLETGALSDQAVDTLSFIFKEENLTFKLTPFINEIIGQLILHVKHIKSIKFFEIFEEAVKSYNNYIIKNPALLVDLLTFLVDRVQLECESIKEKKESKRIILNKIWNIFRQIGENRHYIPKFQEDIEKILTPLFAYLERDEKIPFEDDILKYMISVIRISKKVSNTCWGIFRTFPKIFVRSQKISTLLFVALNQVIIYGRYVLESDSGAVKALIDMGIHTLTYSQANDEKVDISKGALLLQLVIQYFGNISDEDWNRVLGVCTDMLYQAKKKYIKAR